MNMYRHALILAISALVAAACSRAETGRDAPKAFFDLKGYMQQEMQRLAELQPKGVKRISLNGKSETHDFDTLDYEKELEVFSRADINRVAWLDKYEVDSIFQDGQLAQLRYRAKEDKLKTRFMEIQYGPSSQVAAVLIQNHTKSMIAEMQQTIEYRHDKGYRLENRQPTLFAKEKQLGIEVQFDSN